MPDTPDSTDATPAGRGVWAALQLLDRQVVDRDGTPYAKIDDLELTPAEEGPPVLTAILCGPAALAYRLNKTVAAGLEQLRRAVESGSPGDPPGPARIDWGDVTRIGPEIELAITRHEGPLPDVDAWLAEHILCHIPGSGVPRRPRR